MGEFDAVFALVAEPERRWQRLEIEGRSWRDRLAARSAQLAERRERGVGGFDVPTREVEAPGEQEQRWHLWAAEGARVRSEYELGQELVTVVAEGEHWWRWSESLGVSEGAAPTRPVLLMLGPAALALRAGELLGQLELDGLRQVTVAQRPAFSFGARPRARTGRGRLVLREAGAGAEEYRLAIDAERGVLLSLAALRGSRPFQLFETHQVRYDPTIERSRFEVAHQAAGRDRPSLPEAPLEGLSVAELGFAALLPSPSPSPVAPHAALFEHDRRGLGPRHLVLSYVVVDPERGRGQLRLTQAASPLPRPRPDEWQRQGDLEIAEDEYGAVRRRRVRAQRHGVHLELESAVLSLSRLVEIVASLRPGDGAP